MQPPAASPVGSPSTPTRPLDARSVAVPDAGILSSDSPIFLTQAIEVPGDRILALCGSKGLAAYTALAARAERQRCFGRSWGLAPTASELEALMGCSRPYRVLIQDLMQRAGVLHYRYRSVPGDRYRPPHQVLDYRLLAPPARLDWTTVDAVLSYCAAHDKAAAYLAANGGIFGATITVDPHGAWRDLLPQLIEDPRWETIFMGLHGTGKQAITPDQYRASVAAWLRLTEAREAEVLAVQMGGITDLPAAEARVNSVSMGAQAQVNSVSMGSEARVNSVSMGAQAQVNSVAPGSSEDDHTTGDSPHQNAENPARESKEAQVNSVYRLINLTDPNLTHPSDPTADANQPEGMDGWMDGENPGDSLLYQVPPEIPDEIATLFQELNADRVSIVEWLELARLASTPQDWQLVGYVLLRARQRKHGAPTRMTASYVARGLTEARRRLTRPAAPAADDRVAPLMTLLEDAGIRSATLRRDLAQSEWLSAAIVTDWQARMQTMAEHGYIFEDAGAWLASRLRAQEAPIDHETAVAWGTREARKRAEAAPASQEAIVERARQSGFFATETDPAAISAAEATAALQARLRTVPSLEGLAGHLSLPVWHPTIGDDEAIVVAVDDPALQRTLQQHEARIAEEVALLADRRTCQLVFQLRATAPEEEANDDPRRARWIPFAHWQRLPGALQGLLLGSRRQGRTVIAGDRWRQDRLTRYQAEINSLLAAIDAGEEPSCAPPAG